MHPPRDTHALPLQLNRFNSNFQSKNGAKTLLDKFYSDPKRWAYTFESFTFMSRLNIEKERSLKPTSVSCSINERSVYSSKYVTGQNWLFSRFMMSFSDLWRHKSKNGL